MQTRQFLWCLFCVPVSFLEVFKRAGNVIIALQLRLCRLQSNQIKSNLINNKGLKATYRWLRHRLKQ